MLMNLHELFVETIFGGFFLSVLGLMVIMFLIMAMGRISAFTNLTYQGMFLLAMTIGYGYRFISILIWIGIMAWSVREIFEFIKLKKG